MQIQRAACWTDYNPPKLKYLLPKGMVFINFHVNLVTDALKDNQNFDGLLEHVAEVLNHVKYLCKQTMIE